MDGAPSQEEDLGGSLKFGPAVCSRLTDLLDLFAVSANDNYLKVNTWDGSQWSWVAANFGRSNIPLHLTVHLQWYPGAVSGCMLRTRGTNNHILHASQMLLEGFWF